MSPAELKRAAIAAIEAGSDRLTISVPPAWRPPLHFPRVELLSVGADKSRNLSVSARRVLGWLEFVGLADVDFSRGVPK